MASHLQFVPEEAKKWNDSKGRPIAIAEVTVSVIMRMFLLKPTPRNTELILGVIGRAQAKYDFEIYAYAFLSNHGSYLIGVRSAEHMSDIETQTGLGLFLPKIGLGASLDCDPIP